MTDRGFVHPFSPDAWQDPSAAYAWLAEHAPLYDDPVTGAVLLTRWADCDALLRHRHASTAQADRRVALPPSMLTTDPPEHHRLRAIGARLVNPASVEALRPALEVEVDAVLGGLAPSFDAYDDAGLPLAVRTLACLLDVPEDERDQFARLAVAASVNLDPMAAGPNGARAATMLAFYLRSRLAVSTVLSTWGAATGCTEAEAVGVLSLCVIGGVEPLAVVVAAAMLDAANAAREDRDAPAAAEEVVRRGSPIPLVARSARADLTLPSGTVPAGRRVLALLDAANRDAPDAGHLSFGAGPHFCLGAALVRAVLTSVLVRCATLPLAPVSETRSWAPTLVPRRLTPVHLRLGTG